MADQSNGMGAPGAFMMPTATSDGIFGVPPAPGDAPMINMRGPAPPPVEHRTRAPAGAAPPTESYEGGGIFPAGTPGPAEEPFDPEQGGAPRERGLDYGPMMAAPPPMAAPMMPDIGPPPTHGGVLGQTEQDRGTLGMTVIAAAGGAVAGGYYGGIWGALAGSLFGGAAVSAYRAFAHVKQGAPESDKEAITSGTYAVGATVIGGVIWAKLVEEEQQMTANKSKRKNPECDIRPVGP